MMRLVMIAAVGLLLSACGDPFDGHRTEPKFHLGEMVKMKAFGNEGMVVSGFCRLVTHGGACFYEVRFSSMQITTNTVGLGRDKPVEFSPVALVRDVREFELEAAR